MFSCSLLWEIMLLGHLIIVQCGEKGAITPPGLLIIVAVWKKVEKENNMMGSWKKKDNIMAKLSMKLNLVLLNLTGTRILLPLF